jgi:hypothetical protein
MTHYKVDFEHRAWLPALKGVRHKLVRHGGRQLRLVEYTAEMEPHWCERGHIGYILQGRFELEFDGSTLELGPGDGGPVLAVFVEDFEA